MIRDHVGAGTRGIPHEEYNSLLDARRRVLASQSGFNSGTIEDLFPPLVTYIKNTTSAKVPAFGVLGIDSPITPPGSSSTTPATVSFRQRIRFKGVSPSTSTPHYGKFAVLQEPAKAGATVRAVIGGVCLAKLNINDSDDVACDITNGQTSYLSTNMHGSARILWKESSTGTDKWGLIHVGSWVGAMLGKTNGTITKGTSPSANNVSIYTGAEGSEVDTGVDVTAYNRFATVASGKWVIVLSILGRLYLVAAECA